MRILTLSCEYPPIGGGGGRVAEGLARALTDRGHRVDIVTMGYGDRVGREESDGVTVHRVPCLRAQPHRSGPHELATYFATGAWKGDRLARAARYDLIHSHFIVPDGAATLWVARRARLPYVLTAHGSDVPGYNPTRFKALHVALRPFWRRIVENAAALVSPSDHLRRLIARATDRPVERIPNGLEVDFVTPSDRRERRVLVVGRLVERKAVASVVDAWPTDVPDWTLDIVGDGPRRGEIERRAEERGVPVELHGWLDRDSPAFKALYRRSQVFVLPSRAENFPVALLEAMAAGLAVITTSTTGCGEVVGDTGILFEPGDRAALRGALSRLLSDGAERARRGKAARERFERLFTWDRVADRYLEVYRSVVGAPAPEPGKESR